MSSGSVSLERKAAVRKEPAEAQDYESCQLNDMEVDMDENKEESSFIPSAVISSAGWQEPKVMCDGQCLKEGFKYYDTAPAMVEENRREERFHSAMGRTQSFGHNSTNPSEANVGPTPNAALREPHVCSQASGEPDGRGESLVQDAR